MNMLEELRGEELAELKEELIRLKEEITEGLGEASESEVEYYKYLAIVVGKIEALIVETKDLTEIDLPKEVEFAAYFTLLSEMHLDDSDADLFEDDSFLDFDEFDEEKS